MTAATAKRSRTRADIGRANRDKGQRAERDLSRWLRVHGWPNAERKWDNGWQAIDRRSADLGDIRGTPRLVWQSKVRDQTPTSRELARMLADAADQACAAEADYGILVLRRTGKANPGDWWAYVSAGDIASLIVTAGGLPAPVPELRNQVPVCLELAALLTLLHAAGYGQADA